MEVLKVFWELPDMLDTTDNELRGVLTTSSFGTTAQTYSNTKIIDYVRDIVKFNVASSIVLNPRLYVHDLTDGAGHGVLVGTDNIYLQIVSVTTGSANTINCKILYRWKDVSTTEYVGIVQSQQ